MDTDMIVCQTENSEAIHSAADPQGKVQIEVTGCWFVNVLVYIPIAISPWFYSWRSAKQIVLIKIL